MEATGLALGMFCSAEFTTDRMRLNSRDRLVLFTDRISEAQDRRGAELGIQPIIQAAKAQPWSSARETVLSITAQAAEFRFGEPSRDDQAVMVIERFESQRTALRAAAEPQRYKPEPKSVTGTNGIKIRNRDRALQG